MKLFKNFVSIIMGAVTGCVHSGSVKAEISERGIDNHLSEVARCDDKAESAIMKKDASKFLSEEAFWTIIADSDRGRNLKQCLTALSDEELFGFEYWWRTFMSASYKQDLWAVAYVVLGGCSDDGFEYFRCWLIAQGKNVYCEAMNDADSLCDVIVAPSEADDMDYPEQEDLGYAVAEVLGERKGEEGYFYDMVENYEMPDLLDRDVDFEWSEDDEKSIRNVCPRTYDKWWGKMSF